MIGTTVGNYRITEKLGDGGMGAVFRAVDEMLDREVAIKVLRPELARNAALIERFRQEAIALARLNHPRIATLHGLERHDASLLMIMEYVRGDTLEAIVQRSGRIAWARAAELVAATLDALDHAHDKGVVHRDIKPANIMLASNGAVKVMDFGIARLMGKSRQTQVGHAVGTPMYMAPEQLRGEEVDGRTDLYAAGAVLFELVTGRMAFEADSDYALMMKQLNEAPPEASYFVRDVPSVIDEIIQRAMAKQREDRFPDAMAFREALEGAIGTRVAPARRTPNPAETRLAAPVATPASAPSGADDDVRPTTEHALTPPGETRLAPPPPSPSSPSHAASDASIAATRYVDADASTSAPATRLASESYGASGGSGPRDRQPQSGGAAWMRDWRTFAIAGALFVATGLAVRALRPVVPPGGTVTERGDSLLVSPDTARQVALAQSDTLRGPTREESSSLRINAPATPIGGGTPVGGGESGAGGGRQVAPIGGSRTRPVGEGKPVERERSRPVTPVAPVERASKEPVAGGNTGRADPPPTPPTESTNDAEREATAIAAIREAIDGAAATLSGSNTGAAGALLSGAVQDKWIALMKEGRISMSPSGTPSVQLHGARASADFEASVNVRSPFGATKRHSARFSAELERSGSRWRMVGLRAVGGLDLK
ncbi:MAG: serine/threonine-protein kinase [Gemmatimonadota bacterium]